MLSIFSCFFFCHPYVLFGVMLIYIFPSIFYWFYFCFVVVVFIELHKLFFYIGDQSPVGHFLANIFSQCQGWFFVFVLFHLWFLLLCKRFYAYLGSVCFCFYFHYSRRWIKRSCCDLCQKVFYLYFLLRVL